MNTTNGLLSLLVSCLLGFAAFAQEPREADPALAERVARVAQHEHGASRADLVALTNLARAGDDALRAELEAHYLALLAAPHTDAAREFVLRELVVVATERSIPTLEYLLATAVPPFETPLIEALMAAGSREVADRRWTRAFDHTTTASTVAWRREFMRSVAPASVRAHAQARLEAALAQLPGSSPSDAQRDGFSLETAQRLFDELRGAALPGDPLGDHLVALAVEPRVEADAAQRLAALSAAFERGATPQVRARALRGLAERAPETFAELLAGELGARPAAEAAEFLEVVAAHGLAAGAEDDLARALAGNAARQDALGVRARDVLVGRRTAGLDRELAGWIGEPARDDAQRAALLDVLVARGGDGWRAVADASTSGERPLLAAAALRALASAADDRALQLVTKALGDPRIQIAALEALGRWRSLDVYPVLERFVTGEAGERQSAALAAAFALVRTNAGRERDAAGALLVRLAEQCRDAATWSAWIDTAASVPTRGAADVLLGLCADPFHGPAAATAALRVARGLRAREPAVVRRIAAEVLAHTSDAALVRGAKAELDALEANEDFLLAWRIAGPFTRDGVKGEDILAEVFLPETEPDSPAILWRDVFASGTDDRGTFDLTEIVGGENCTVYARTNIWSETAQRVRLEFGSDDALCVWFAGREVLRNDVQRGLSRASDVVEVDLAAGWNTLMLEVGQGGGGWGFCARLRATDGTPASGWRCDRIQRGHMAPPGAVQLVGPDGAAFRHLDGRALEWRVEGGVMRGLPGSGDVVSERSFGDASVHVEFRVPEEPHLENGQGRGNSGVYLQGRYEVQVLNSFGEPPRIDECGAIYGVAAPRVQASLRPGEWQVYDIEFTAARWQDGVKVSDARLTVFHNGVLIHDDVRVGGSTGAGQPELEGHGPLLLQDHGHELEYRNVWVLPHDESAAAGLDFAPLFADGPGTQRGGRATYEVQGDTIVGRTAPRQPNSFLCSRDGLADFVLEFDVEIHPELNSGVQIRSQVHPDVAGGAVFGYQVELDPSSRAFTGAVYDESRRGWLDDFGDDQRARGAFRIGAVNHLRVVARGDVLRTWINGVPGVVLVDGATPAGFIGLQVHGVGDRADPLEVRWRGLRLAPL